MAKLILKIPYIKSGKVSHKKYLVKYIATREGVQFVFKNSNLNSSENQKQLIKNILKDYPDSKYIFEYDDYIKNPTKKNASEFITMALEHNLDKIAHKENYIGYIANRANVEKVSSHGLFTAGDEKIVLSKVAEEVSKHTGNVWTPIISLKREDAKRTGFNNAKSWKLIIERQAMNIADAMKIPHKDFVWYAAFHDESYHPHIHMICYNKNPNKEYLSKQGIANIKSDFINDIFKDELIPLYQEKTKRRDELKKEVKKAFAELKTKVAKTDYTNSNLEDLILKLNEKLKTHKGKKQFGYLQPHTKNIVNSIVDELAKEENINSAFELWQDLQDEIYYGYRDTLPERLPLSEQKEFKSIKNMIIAEVLNFEKVDEIEKIKDVEKDMHIEEIATAEDTKLQPDNGAVDIQLIISEKISSNNYHIDWSNAYMQAKIYLHGNKETLQDSNRAFELMVEESEKNNVLAIFDLARMHMDGLGTDIDKEKACELYLTALLAFKEIEKTKPHKYVEYRIGKMYMQGLGVEKDYEIASSWLEKSASKGYKYAEYSLGGLYYRGQGVEQNYEKAFELYLKSAKQGFPYAQFEVAKMYQNEIGTLKNIEESNKYYKLAFKNFMDLEKENPDDKLQYRIGAMLHKGEGTDIDISKAKIYYEKSAKAKNPHAAFALSKLILDDENSTTKEISKAVEYLKLSAESENEFAMYALAKIYLDGNLVSKDIGKAVELLAEVAYRGNQYAQYQLGKLYFFGKEVNEDRETAIKWLTLSAEQGNEYAKLFLENIDKWNNPSIGFTVKNLFISLSKIFEENTPRDSTTTMQKIDSKALKKLRALKLAKGQKHTGEDLENTYQMTL